jgi:hypothetical protein
MVEVVEVLDCLVAFLMITGWCFMFAAANQICWLPVTSYFIERQPRNIHINMCSIREVPGKMPPELKVRT